MTLQQNCRQGKVLGGRKRAAVRGGVGCGGSAMGQSAELIVKLTVQLAVAPFRVL